MKEMSRFNGKITDESVSQSDLTSQTAGTTVQPQQSGHGRSRVESFDAGSNGSDGHEDNMGGSASG